MIKGVGGLAIAAFMKLAGNQIPSAFSAQLTNKNNGSIIKRGWQASKGRTV
jgi:hypothetical protein